MRHLKIKNRFVSISGVLIFSFLLKSSSIQAALPPIYESEREFQSLLSSPKMHHLMNGHLLTSVSNDFENAIFTGEGNCEVHSKLKTVSLPHGMVGPRRYEIVDIRVIKGCESKSFVEAEVQGRINLFKRAASLIGSLSNHFEGSGVIKIDFLSSNEDNSQFLLHGANGSSVEIEVSKEN